MAQLLGAVPRNLCIKYSLRIGLPPTILAKIDTNFAVMAPPEKSGANGADATKWTISAIN
jgi:hypothetical protein